jgi:lysophospholipase L1-like esterase
MPNLYELAQGYFDLFIHEYKNAMTKLEKDTGSKKFRYFDGSSLFQEDIDTLFVDPIHFNDQGQLVIADQIFDFLQEMESFQ